MSQTSQEFQESGGDETGETISLEVTSTSSHSKKSPASAQNEENDNPTDDETPLLSNVDFNSRIITVEDEYLSSTKYPEDPLKPKERGTIFSSFLNMANSIIGAGLPYAFKEAGVFMGILLLIGLTITVDWTIRLLVYNSKLSGRNSYQEIMNYCFGKSGYITISLFQFVFAFGGMCAFCVIIGDTIPQVISSLFPTLYRDISNLAKASGLALISMIIIVVGVAIEGPKVDSSLKGNKESWQFVRPEVFQRFAVVTHWSTGISMVACMVMGLTGYLTFTDKTQDNNVINIARFCFGFNMFTTLPHVFITTLLVGSAMGISLITSDLGVVLELTGGFSATALAYILPPLCFLKLTSGKWYEFKKIPAILCVSFGFCVMVLSTILSIRSLIT
ncbi:3001_t:CDS:2 [Diversispora eburnea]|uniref:3001_t:CDS:1 n=1 Tax=Diversispora eburnea TaxID=1213867 RepID=A0A9N8VG83_9GLOM|nr:3001_t:CDS:2 [Diversispora eburnea]